MDEEKKLADVVDAAFKVGWERALEKLDRNRAEWIRGSKRFTLSIFAGPKGRVLDCGSGYAVVSLTGFGGNGYVPFACDYDGDGLADLALYHETTGTWLARLSAAGYALARLEGFGGFGYVPVLGDFDGDGPVDLVIYETATSTWTFRLSSMRYAPLPLAF